MKERKIKELKVVMYTETKNFLRSLLELRITLPPPYCRSSSFLWKVSDRQDSGGPAVVQNARTRQSGTKPLKSVTLLYPETTVKNLKLFCY